MDAETSQRTCFQSADFAANNRLTFANCPSCPNHETNHEVIIVGWSTDSAGKKYWLARNSWGATWGDDGYFRIERGLCASALDMYIPSKVVVNGVDVMQQTGFY
jgi:C1A family cysteine protease